MNYKKIYDKIIHRAKSQNRCKGLGIYYEAHHIIPKCMEGTGHASQWKWHHNIVLLTAKEHLLCHLLLIELYPNNKKLIYAIHRMITSKNKNYKISLRLYEYIKIKNSKAKSEELKETNPMNALESRKKANQSLINFYKNNNSKLKGLIVINKNEKQKFVSEDDLSEYIKIGWKRGYSKTAKINRSKGQQRNKNPRAKAILQYDIEGNFIKRWDCMKDIELELKIPHSKISVCCSGKIKNIKSFIFKYEQK